MSSNNVQVAVRIRPKQQKEEINMCNICTRVSPSEPQIWLGRDENTFTFDHVFDIPSNQNEIYSKCVEPLVDGCFDGFNATVLAYGQTGSGKTYTMGTGFDVSCPDNQKGIIPRAVSHLFTGIQKRRDEAMANGEAMPEFTVTAQFIEIYNEEIIDLLCENRKKGNLIRVHEDSKRGIVLIGAENKQVNSAEETLACLKAGSLFRTTGATLMNSESSRSHAIFTLFIKQTRVDRVQEVNDENQPPMSDTAVQQELITLTAKFNFVDLAGSERLSRTGAVGERAREGISINSGLLYLGNVISALGDRTKKATHIPYRDSKLTRVLQDSLGGNSVTTMIACISPCDRDFVETLNTLRYANRAKNIKNKVVANQDSQTQLINELRRKIFELQVENQELKQGKMLVKSDGEIEMNDVYIEKEMLQRDLNNLKIRNKALSARLEELENENMAFKLNKIGSADNDEEDRPESEEGNAHEDYRVSGNMIKGYLKEINTLRTKISENDALISQLRKQLSIHNNGTVNGDNASVADFFEKARQKLEFEKSLVSQLANNANDEEDSSNEDEEEEANDEFEKNIAIQKAEILTLEEIIMEKERMIEEAEIRERRIIELTEHYEKKISTFKDQIRQTEDERDNLMNKFKKENKDDHSIKQMRQDYERQLQKLQKEMRQYENLKREHQKTVQKEVSFKEQLNQMRNEVIETKKTRVKLLGQMREQMNKHNKEIQKNRLEINKLTRVKSKNEFQIKGLQTQSNQQKRMLQRREEEIKALRRQMKPMSERVAGRLQMRSNFNGHTPQKARNKWTMFEQKFNKLLLQRTTCDNEEKKLARLFDERQLAAAEINEAKQAPEVNEDLLDSLEKHYQYLSQCIDDSQAVLSQFEADDLNIEQLFFGLDAQDMIYVMNKVVATAINYAIEANEKDNELKEKGLELRKLDNEHNMKSQILNFMVEKNMNGETSDILPAVINSIAIDSSPPNCRSVEKFRRLTMTPSELLYFQQPKPKGMEVITNDNLEAVKKEIKTFKADHNQTFVVDQEKNFNETFTVDYSNGQDCSPAAVAESGQDHEHDRMTQSLHFENQKSRQYDQLNGCAGGATPSKSIFDHEPEMVRVPSAPSLKELNTVGRGNSTAPTTCASLSPQHQPRHQQQQQQHYLLSPHLMRRRMQQQQQYQQQQQQQSGWQQHHHHNNNVLVFPTSPAHASTPRSPNGRALSHSVVGGNNGNGNGSNTLNNNYVNGGGVLSSNYGLNSVNNNNNNLNNNCASPLSGVVSTTSTTNPLSNYYHHPTASPQASPLPHRNAFLQDAQYHSNSFAHTPPGSPSVNRRLNHASSMASSLTTAGTAAQDNDVFSRLTNTGSVSSNLAENSVGQIISMSSSSKQDKNFPLVCTQSAVGHQRPVLSVTATKSCLFSASKDGTAKLWDLEQLVEVCSLTDHPDAVNVIRYDEANKQIFTCSKSQIKIWDPRQNPINCVRTLCSSVVYENILPDTFIYDMRLSQDGHTMFCTNEKLVRVFDLRASTDIAISKLQTGHKSLVTCLAVSVEHNNGVVVTGSKDHTIKVFNVDDNICMSTNHLPKCALKPPHYDGIEALMLTNRGNCLFSGGRDGCIKKWSLLRESMVASLSNCHRDWVLAMGTLENETLLLSACRGGTLRVMSTDTCDYYGSVQAHNAAINDIATLNEDRLAFTASNDGSINIWKVRDDTRND